GDGSGDEPSREFHRRARLPIGEAVRLLDHRLTLIGQQDHARERSRLRLRVGGVEGLVGCTLNIRTWARRASSLPVSAGDAQPEESDESLPHRKPPRPLYLAEARPGAPVPLLCPPLSPRARARAGQARHRRTSSSGAGDALEVQVAALAP